MDETELPGTVPVTFPSSGETLQIPAFWDPLEPADVAAPGTLTVAGSVLGYAGGRVTAQVTVIDPGDTAGDETPPVVTLTPSGSAGSAGWFRSDVRVRVAGADDRGGRVTIEAAVDGGTPVTAGPVRYTDVTVTGDGQHTVVATATDRAGNESDDASLAVRIDRVAPASTGTVDGARRSVTISATDATSGLARIEYAIDTGGVWTPYEGRPVKAPDTQRHQVFFRATDVAGNVETTRSAVLPADISGPLTGNVAPLGTAAASYTAGWNAVGALNDGLDPANPSQAQLWGTWSGTRPASQWAQYTWARPIRLTSAEIKFWRDQPKGTGDGVAEPDAWVLQYWDGAAWVDVAEPSGYGTSTTAFNTVTFAPVTTDRLRATLAANGNGTTFSAVAATEWRVFADDPGVGPVVPVTVQAETRCLGRTGFIAVRVTNDHDAPIDVRIETPYGIRSFRDVEPGRVVSQSLAARTAQIPAGEVTVEATGTVEGEQVTSEVVAAYQGTTCG